MPNCSPAAARLLVHVARPPLSSRSSFLLTVSPRPPRHDLASHLPFCQHLPDVHPHFFRRLLGISFRASCQSSACCAQAQISLLSVAPVPGHPGPKASLFCLHLEHTVLCGTAQADGAVTPRLRLFWLQVTENSYWNRRDLQQTQRSWHQTQLNPAFQMAPSGHSAPHKPRAGCALSPTGRHSGPQLGSMPSRTGRRRPGCLCEKGNRKITRWDEGGGASSSGPSFSPCRAPGVGACPPPPGSPKVLPASLFQSLQFPQLSVAMS